MKVTRISPSNTSSDDMMMEQFVMSSFAETVTGKLLIALAAETAWSDKYSVSARFHEDKSYLNVWHPSFMPGNGLVLYTETVKSVRDVEDAVRVHLQQSEDSLQPTLSLLQNKKSELRDARETITVGKAKAAIVAVFPEAVDAYHNSAIDSGDIRTFVLNQDEGRHEQVFVAREIDGEFVRGVAKISIMPLALHEMDNINRHRCFWEALARAFVAKKLGIPEKSMLFQGIDVEAKELLWPRPLGYDPYIVHKVVFRNVELQNQFPDRETVVVTFGADNLPEEVTMQPATEQID